MDQKLQSLIDRLEKVVERAEASAGSAPVTAAASAGPVAATVKAWQKDVMSKVQSFKDATAALNIP